MTEIVAIKFRFGKVITHHFELLGATSVTLKCDRGHFLCGIYLFCEFLN